jgi:hypothetical protein
MEQIEKLNKIVVDFNDGSKRIVCFCGCPIVKYKFIVNKHFTKNKQHIEFVNGIINGDVLLLKLYDTEFITTYTTLLKNLNKPC